MNDYEETQFSTHLAKGKIISIWCHSGKVYRKSQSISKQSCRKQKILVQSQTWTSQEKRNCIQTNTRWDKPSYNHENYLLYR